LNLREPTFPISGVNIVGGIAGSNTGVLNYVRSNTGCIAIHGPVGGITGVNSGTIQYADCTRQVHGEWAVGGLIGENNGTLSQSHSINQSSTEIGLSK